MTKIKRAFHFSALPFCPLEMLASPPSLNGRAAVGASMPGKDSTLKIETHAGDFKEP
jgi:hypothetical protein